MLTKIAMIESFSKENKLERSLTAKIIQEHERKVVDGSISDEEKCSILEELPMFFKILVAQNMFHGEIRSNVFFKGKDDVFLTNILTHMVSHEFQKGEVVYNKGDYATHIYLVLNGRVNFITGKHNTCFKTITRNSYFGEVEIFSKELRKHTVRAETDHTQVLMLSRKVFIETLKRVPEYELGYIKVAVERDFRNQISLQRVKKLLQLNKNSFFWEENPKTRKIKRENLPWDSDAEPTLPKLKETRSQCKKVREKMSTIKEKSEKDENSSFSVKKEGMSQEDFEFLRLSRKVSPFIGSGEKAEKSLKNMKAILLTNPEICFIQHGKKSQFSRHLSMEANEKNPGEDMSTRSLANIAENPKGNQTGSSNDAISLEKSEKSRLGLSEAQQCQNCQKMKAQMEILQRDNRKMAGMIQKLSQKIEELSKKESPFQLKPPLTTSFLKRTGESSLKVSSDEFCSQAPSSRPGSEQKLLFETFKVASLKAKVPEELEDDDDFIGEVTKTQTVLYESMCQPEKTRRISFASMDQGNPELFLKGSSIKNFQEYEHEDCFIDSSVFNDKHFKHPEISNIEHSPEISSVMNTSCRIKPKEEGKELSLKESESFLESSDNEERHQARTRVSSAII